MRAIVIRSFISTIDGVKYRGSEGDEIEVPKGADWMNAGFVEPLNATKRETAAVEPANETAAAPKPRRRKTRAKKG